MLLHKFLHEEHIKIPLQAEERNSSIRELLELLSFDTSDSEMVYQAILEREKVITTGIGNGIAIPHCKSSLCTEFFIALGISRQGIDFNAVDHTLVNCIFLLLGPEDAPNIHIKLLSRISRVMNSQSVRTRCIQAAGSSEVYRIIEAAENDLQEI